MKLQFKQTILWCLFILPIFSATATADIAQRPLFVGSTASPLVMITMGRDHKLYYEAYNDASDLDGDGALDVRYKPSIDYLGYFDSYKCYDYSSGMFEPDISSYDSNLLTRSKTCSGNWSGDFLNYLTTTRMDALRKVLYGGMRSVDTITETILERVYIPQDAHGWGKEYKSIAVDGYDISDYTPFVIPATGLRHLFGNTTELVPSNTAGDPELRVLENSTARIWQWASKESPVLDTNVSSPDDPSAEIPVSPVDYTVRVKVCELNMLEENCKAYSNGHYKPTGILHDYGESDELAFGLLTGSFNRNASGGVLRKNIASFTNEIDPATGQVVDSGGIINSIDKLRIIGFGLNGGPVYLSGWITGRPIVSGEARDWGNPIAEMMYESLRYFAGKSGPTAAFETTSSELDLPMPAWQNPYRDEADGGYPHCAKPLQLVISDINPSYDTDQLPGSSFGGIGSDLSGMNVSSLADTIWAGENEGNFIFIGESNGNYDGTPSPKAANSFSNIRGISPEEPTKEGGYYSASVALYGKQQDINPVEGDQNVDTLAVVLASPIPTIDFAIGNQRVKLVPFAKSVANYGIDSTEGNFQPTNQIVDFYVEEIANTNLSNINISVNGGRPYGKFRISFEDVEQAADHDMDAIATYTVNVTGDGKIKVSMESTYASGVIQQHLGYIISGTTADGIYLDIRDIDTAEAADTDYFLDTPPGEGPGGNWSDDDGLPLLSDRFFTVGNTAAGDFIKHDPLWYAVKWSSDDPLDPAIWDADSDGDPDGYYLVTNAGKLQEQLEDSFAALLERGAAGGAAVVVNSARIDSNSKIYQASFDTDGWEGHFRAFKIDENDGSIGAEQWNVADKIPAAAGRNIYSYDSIAGSGIDFNYGDLNVNQQALLDQNKNGVVDGLGADRVDFIRGDTSNDGGIFRDRVSRLGDLINSSPTIVGKTENFGYGKLPGAEGAGYRTFRTTKLSRRSALYFGANDGMLHAIDADLGDEIFTYVPDAVIGSLNHLTSTNYVHRYYVDGDMIASDAYINNTWKTMLVGTLGRGGKGAFALDVSNPNAFNSNKVMWEISDTQAPGGAADLAAFQADLGYTLPQTTTVRIRDRFVTLLANGYESANGSAVLFILDAETGHIIERLDTGAVGANGLSAAIPVDQDRDGIVETIYAGDLQGNVWRFKDETFSGWESELLFVAKSGGLRQPITAKLQVGLHPDGEFMIYFGTGKYYGVNDVQIPAGVQSFYGIRDEGTLVSTFDLQEQTIDYEGPHPNTSAFWVRVTSSEDVNYTTTPTQKGWYMDLKSPTNGLEGERVVSRALLRSGRIIFVTMIPDEDPCKGGGTSWLMEMDAVTGKRLEKPPIDVNNDGHFDDNDLVPMPSGDPAAGSGYRPMNDDEPGGIFNTPAVYVDTNGNEHKAIGDSNVQLYEIGESNDDPVGRQSWRELPYN